MNKIKQSEHLLLGKHLMILIRGNGLLLYVLRVVRMLMCRLLIA